MIAGVVSSKLRARRKAVRLKNRKTPRFQSNNECFYHKKKKFHYETKLKASIKWISFKGSVFFKGFFDCLSQLKAQERSDSAAQFRLILLCFFWNLHENEPVSNLRGLYWNLFCHHCLRNYSALGRKG